LHNDQTLVIKFLFYLQVFPSAFSVIFALAGC
jgi:hypothetical protein